MAGASGPSPRTGPEPKRLASAFVASSAAARGAFIPYLTSGFPTLTESDRLAAALCEEGADVLELGVPFSDPVADGPVIQRTTQIALEGGATLAHVLGQAMRLRARHETPIVLMSYLNPIARYGVARFTDDAAAAGVDGIILVDLPPEEEPATWRAFDDAGIDTITLVAPTTDASRLRTIAARARGFLYVVARLGVTGKGRGDAGVVGLLDRCRSVTALPRCIGFGMTPETDLAPYRAHAEGIVVGSSLLEPLLDSWARDGAAGEEARDATLRALARRFRANVAAWRAP
ncbi:MAG TPA: tryptophan synthase subunit alpha [Candidatus Eisenbacteria bacterium]|nr:tryptophan synthase subunit alpha [Candidatus Eisenbacteria bacterium]